MIGIRVDVNQVIATGHIKRDIEIALCLRKMGEECIFVSADEQCLTYLETYKFKSVILNSRWDFMEEPEKELQNLDLTVLHEVILKGELNFSQEELMAQNGIKYEKNYFLPLKIW